MADEHTDVLPQPRSDQVQTRPWSPVVLGALMATEGVAFAVLLGLDGSAPWRVVRVLVVIVVTALAVWFIRRAGRTGQGAAALLLGMAGTVAGAGAASGHLAEAGLDATAVAAAIVLVTGGRGNRVRWLVSGRWKRPSAIRKSVARGLRRFITVALE